MEDLVHGTAASCLGDWVDFCGRGELDRWRQIRHGRRRSGLGRRWWCRGCLSSDLGCICLFLLPPFTLLGLGRWPGGVSRRRLYGLPSALRKGSLPPRGGRREGGSMLAAEEGRGRGGERLAAGSASSRGCCGTARAEEVRVEERQAGCRGCCHDG